MPKEPLPAFLSPHAVVALTDALLANADSLLTMASDALTAGKSGLARSLAILGLEESGKAIALHNRRIRMAYGLDGEPFVDEELQRLWSDHGLKLRAVHRFLREEKYWFGTEPPVEIDAFVLDEIDTWAHEKNRHKQAGFYVDLDPVTAEISRPSDFQDGEGVAQVLDAVHQIGWQLRLGEHIEARKLEDEMRAMAPRSKAEAQAEERIARLLPDQRANDVIENIHYRAVREIANIEYLHHLDANSFANVGKPGYEAEDKELWRLFMETHGGTEAQGGESAV